MIVFFTLVTLFIMTILVTTWFTFKPLWLGRLFGRHYVWYPVRWRGDDYSVCMIKRLPDGTAMYYDGLDWHVIDWTKAIPITWKEDEE